MFDPRNLREIKVQVKMNEGGGKAVFRLQGGKETKFSHCFGRTERSSRGGTSHKRGSTFNR